jgi:hypothetical protein
MFVPNVHICSIELGMLSIEASRRDIIGSALQARDMTLGPRRYVADDLRVAIEAIGTMILTVSHLLVGK